MADIEPLRYVEHIFREHPILFVKKKNSNFPTLINITIRSQIMHILLKYIINKTLKMNNIQLVEK